MRKTRVCFLLWDESEDGDRKILGGVLLPDAMLPDFERDFVSARMEHKLFGEIKWIRIDKKYKEEYCKFVDLFLDYKEMTFHAISYTGGDDKYQGVAYTLIRYVVWKMKQAGIQESLTVLFDNDGFSGREGSEWIRSKAKSNHLLKDTLLFCNQGASHVLGVLQIADLLSGSVASTVNNVGGPHKQLVRDHALQGSNNIKSNVTSVFTDLHVYKIHLFNIEDDLEPLLSSSD